MMLKFVTGYTLSEWMFHVKVITPIHFVFASNTVWWQVSTSNTCTIHLYPLSFNTEDDFAFIPPQLREGGVRVSTYHKHLLYSSV